MQADRASAIEGLRREQALARAQLASGPIAPQGQGLQRALEIVASREAAAQQRDGHYLIEGQRYPIVTERLRWARTREILERVSPGMDEDPRQLEFLARQAASIEMMMRGELAQGSAAGTALCERILLGTFPQLVPDAAQRRHGEHFFVLLSAGLIDFVYQAAKAAVLSWPLGPREHPQHVSFRNDPGDVEEHLAGNPYPAMLLERTLRAFLYSGIPRDAMFSRMPLREHEVPLRFLTNFNERFIIAHEYAHVFHEAHDIVAEGAHANEEFAADAIALQLVIESGAALDLMPSGIAAQGAYFVLTALDILRRALDLARHGEIRDQAGFGGHPPLAARLQMADATLQRLAAQEEDVDLAVEKGQAAARTLELLWKRLMVSRAFLQPGRDPHPLWQGA